MLSPKMLKDFYDKGNNLSTILRKEYQSEDNTEEIIELIYDIQAGNYIHQFLHNEKINKLKNNIYEELSKIILSLCKPRSILEAGIGEATTFSGVRKRLGNSNITSYGFDLSWSRIALAREWIKYNKINNVNLCVASLFNIPYRDNSIDLVYTYHSIEPNRGKEKFILKELYRVTNKYLILLEPAYKFADETTRKRMDSLGYIKDLNLQIDSLGFNVIQDELFTHYASENPTSITVIKKNNNHVNCESNEENIMVCPQYKTGLTRINDLLYSEEAQSVYPIIDGIPCLRVENAIVASKFFDIIRGCANKEFGGDVTKQKET